MRSKNQSFILKLCYAAVCLALCMVLPFLTGQIPQIGSMLSPMHIPVLLAGYLCGPWWAAAVGVIAPLLCHAIFSMPPLMTALAMCFELTAYGIIAGVLYRKLPKRPSSVYISLLSAMVGGRIVWGIASFIIQRLNGSSFTLQMFFAGAFAQAIPGIILHILLIPVIVIALQKAHIIRS